MSTPNIYLEVKETEEGISEYDEFLSREFHCFETFVGVNKLTARQAGEYIYIKLERENEKLKKELEEKKSIISEFIYNEGDKQFRD